MEQPLVSLGIDMSKATFHAAVFKDDKRVSVKEFRNNEAGFAQLSEWLQQQGIEHGHPLTSYLYQFGHTVSIVDPTGIKEYGQSQLCQTKNDRANAKLIAQFCRDIKPSLWQPSEAVMEELQAFTRCLEALEQIVLRRRIA